MVESTLASLGLNPFNMQPGDRSAAPSPQTASFEQQLSQALSESLSRLGVRPGAVNITISGGTSPSARQILITYSDTGSASQPTGPLPSTTPSTSSATPQTNQSSGSACATPWSPWDGPRDSRDTVPPGCGLLTASGAPAIQLNERPAANQYGYAGLAALNPYFTTPSNPNRPGYVLGFANWFNDAQILGGKNGPVQANRLYYSTQEGAQEALRLVRQYEPGAELTQYSWGGGPYSQSSAMHYIVLPGERMLNAGLLLAGYYNHGEGVTVSSDADLARAVRGA